MSIENGRERMPFLGIGDDDPEAVAPASEQAVVSAAEAAPVPEPAPELEPAAVTQETAPSAPKELERRIGESGSIEVREGQEPWRALTADEADVYLAVDRWKRQHPGETPPSDMFAIKFKNDSSEPETAPAAVGASPGTPEASAAPEPPFENDGQKEETQKELREKIVVLKDTGVNTAPIMQRISEVNSPDAAAKIEADINLLNSVRSPLRGPKKAPWER